MIEGPDEPRQFDFLVIGSGIAGLHYALRVAEHGRVGIVTKKEAVESATNWAQGGIAAVTSQHDSVESHLADTLRVGRGLCKEPVVRFVVEHGPRMIRRLIDLGVDFDRPIEEGIDEPFDLGREGGHTQRRVLHHRDATGREIERVLLHHATHPPNVTMFENHMAVDLLTSQRAGAAGPNRVLGAYVLDPRTGAVERCEARITLLASGGCGKVYRFTSNPNIASGDGVAMAYRAGASIANMEFVQFHPTCLYHPKAKSFLITEALRGEGARLADVRGRRFMTDYSARGELAARDVVARAIDTELKRTGDEYVTLNIWHKDARFIRERFPTIFERCLEYGIDITKDPIPVVPAAHYCCGGVVTNLEGETDLANLFAAGEVTCTGLHGANRLASNSLLEAIVFADAAATAGIARLAELPEETADIEPWYEGAATESDEAVVITQNWDEIRRFMWNYVGIVRSDKRLERARRRIELLQDEITEYYWNFRVTPDLIELRNLALVAELVIESAIQRKESRGLHYNLDHPQSDDARFGRDTILRR